MRDPNRPSYIYGETFSEQAPRPALEAYSVLSRFISGEAIFYDTLNDIFKALGNTEYETIDALDERETKGIITRQDRLILVVLLAISRTLGPELSSLRQAILTGNVADNETELATAIHGLDKRIAGYLQNVLPKLKK